MTRPTYSVFVVEDEAMIRMLVVEMLEELGHTVAAASSSEFDLAVLDINLASRSSLPVAEVIKARKLPFIFSTGYGASGIPPDFADVPAIQKPFTIEALGRMINELMRIER